MVKARLDENHCGKIRCATKHPADVVISARAITQWLLAKLRNIRTNKSMLRNEVVQLRTLHGQTLTTKNLAIVYSADLSKATDHVSCATALLVVGTALRSTHAPQWTVDALPGVVGHMVLNIEKGSEASDHLKGVPLPCGALMGLGPSWIALSLLNDFAACAAGASPEEFAREYGGKIDGVRFLDKGLEDSKLTGGSAQLAKERHKSCTFPGISASSSRD
jgi:hypothetical protein